MKVLIIEDSPEVCKWIARFIGRKCEVVETTSPDQANTALIRESFDVIVSDISMPGQDGDDFLLAHKDLVGSAHVVFVSASEESRLTEAKSKLVENGFSGVSCIQKPIVLSELLESIT